MDIELSSINKRFGRYEAARQVSFAIKKGRLVGLLGPSGSGKTTILRMIAGLEQPDSGEIRLGGRVVNDVPAAQRGIGFVFQNYALFAHLTVFDNVAFGLKIQRREKRYIRERVGELLELVGLAGLEKRFPYQLSGGQRQRVAFARALAPHPQLLLLDEPFAAIDAKVRKELRNWLKELIGKVGITSIFVTHDQEEAVEVADEIIIANQGRIEQSGSPLEIYKQPKTPFVARFIGRSTVVTDYGRLKGFETVSGAARAVIRPEFLQVSRSGQSSQFQLAAETGVVETAVFRGDCMELAVKVKGIRMYAARSLEKPQIRPGEEVRVLIYRLYVFDKNRTYLLENSNLNTAPVFYI